MKKAVILIIVGLWMGGCVSSEKKKKSRETWRPVKMILLDREACGRGGVGASDNSRMVPVLSGDFDGDGRIDSAAMVERIKILENGSKPLALGVMVVLAGGKVSIVGVEKNIKQPYKAWIETEAAG